ncbi:BMP family protein [Moorella sp. Hama-1]|uniref:BMP family protein n=1 Tax=Neomoorella TaxID=44260 RepID=UPI000D6505D0|nr:BMP family protein [Moorella sp. Hama-1]MDN5362379.1 basic rane protein [Moorella sp. (in: firmicutes)]BCV23094.1 BMP family ABC transporter substrate-binding protein [Moorella sp. Hama-1]
MRKVYIWGIILALAVFTAAFLGGCGNKAANPPKEGTKQETGAGQQAETKKLKIAMLLPGTINDNGWNASAYEGLMLAKEKEGAEVAYRENVSQSDQEEAFRAYASSGYNVIFAHGFEFGDAAKKVAKDFPKTKFVVTSSDISQEPNVASLDIANKEVGFLGGVAAGLITKSNKVGFVGGMSIPSIINCRDGFIAGAKYANPGVTVLDSLTGNFDDAAKAREMAVALINQGADIVMQDADQAGLGVIQAGKDKKVLVIGYGKDQSNLAPENVVVSSKQSVPVGIAYITDLIAHGQFQAKAYLVGIKEGATGLYWNEQLASKVVKPEAKQKIEAIMADLKAGKINVDELIAKSKNK